MSTTSMCGQLSVIGNVAVFKSARFIVDEVVIEHDGFPDVESTDFSQPLEDYLPGLESSPPVYDNYGVAITLCNQSEDVWMFILGHI